MNYWETFVNAYSGYARYLWYEVTHPSWGNYFYWLLLVSAFFFALEIFAPWREKQSKFRKDFWLDFFYMFFNFFLFSLIIYAAASKVIVQLLNNAIFNVTAFDLQASNPMQSWPMWAVLLTGFVVRDFVQWWIHRLLHRVAFLWEFHKVHHSVEQMGFAAHLRYHWMENVVYRTLEYIPLALLGIGLYDFFIIHIFTLAVGHYNHSNFVAPSWISGGLIGTLIGIVIGVGLFDVSLLGEVDLIVSLGVVLVGAVLGALALGPVMKVVFNSPEMHIWHHAYEWPDSHPHGINFGLTLAIWDYIFGTAHMPDSGRDIRLGFPGVEEFPQDFIKQNTHGFVKK